MNFKNPIIAGFNPDPSICEVNGKFYIVCSTFEYFPGLPIYESDNLVDWKCVNHVITHNSKINFKDTPNSLGIFAPTIRYDKKNNRVLIITTDVAGNGNLIFASDSIYEEFNILSKISYDGIDPSLMYDETEEKWYFTAQKVIEGKDSIVISEIDIDKGILIGNSKTISNGIVGRSVEGPHVYQIGKYYYLLCSEGGTEYGHMITQMRATSIMGPYSSAPQPILLTHSNLNDQIQATGHGDLIFYNDSWYIVHLAIRKVTQNYLHHLGRETFLTPVKFENGWFQIENKRTYAEYSCNDGSECHEMTKHYEDVDEFENIDLEWITPRITFTEFCNFQYRELQIYNTDNKIMNDFCPPAILKRQQQFDIEVETRIIKKVGNEFSGLTVYYNNQYHYEFGFDKQEIVVRVTQHGHTYEAFREKCEEMLTLKIIADEEDYHFIYNNIEVIKLPTAGVSTEQTRTMTFTGVLIGLFSECESCSFEYFKHKIIHDENKILNPKKSFVV